MKTAAGRRRFTFLRGIGAERFALAWLMLKGYRPLARRYAQSGGEIDLVMKRGDTIAFVEVKARASLDMAATSLDEAKRRKIRRAARAWIARHPSRKALTFRVDAVFVAPGEWPRHQPNAFELD